MVSAPRGMSEWAAKGTGGQRGRQMERCQGNEEERMAWAGKRAAGPRPPHLSATFPALPESGKTHPVCLGGWAMAFLKNSFLQSIKKISEKTSAKVPFSQIFGIGRGAGVAASGPGFPIAVARPGPHLGELPGPRSSLKRGLSERQEFVGGLRGVPGSLSRSSSLW